MAKDLEIGCYIHIPFCKKICSYCDFCKVFYDEGLVDEYLDELDREIKNSYNGETIDTLYIGGGTPSALTKNQLEYLFSIIEKNFNLKKELEYTVECNFDSIDKEKLDLMKKHGINRISFGLESINNKNLEKLDRLTDKKKAKEIVAYCKKIGLKNINLDLMYAIPGETIEVLKKDLKFVKELDPTHISTYSLIIEEHTRLSIDGTHYIDENLDREMYDTIIKELKDYDHYEISNFAKKKNYRSKHNLKYWNNKEYYAYGLGSAGYEGRVRYQHTKSINKYLDGDYMMENGIEILSDKEKIEYEVLLNLRTKDGIDLREFEKNYKSRLDNHYNYKKLIDEKLLVEENRHVFIPEDLWYISNSVIVRLLEEEVNGER